MLQQSVKHTHACTVIEAEATAGASASLGTLRAQGDLATSQHLPRCGRQQQAEQQQLSDTNTKLPQLPAHGRERWEAQRQRWLQPSKVRREPCRERVIGTKVAEETLIIDGQVFTAAIWLPEIVDLIVQDWLSDGMFDEVSSNDDIGE